MLFYAAALQTLNYDWDTLSYHCFHLSAAWIGADSLLVLAKTFLTIIVSG